MRSHSSDFLSQHHAWQAAAAAAWNYWRIKVAVSEMPRLAGEMGMLWQRLGLFCPRRGFFDSFVRPSAAEVSGVEAQERSEGIRRHGKGPCRWGFERR